MRSLSFFSLAACAALVAAAPSRAAPRHVLHERRDAPPTAQQWVKRDALASHIVLPMRIGLTQSNMDRAHDLLMEVSDPKSHKYGQHYTTEEVHGLFAPSDESVAAVHEWLHDAGIDLGRVSQSLNKQWIQFDASTAEAEALLLTKFHEYEHLESGKISIGCDEYHVHENVRRHVDYVTPGVKMLGAKKRMASKSKRSFVGAQVWNKPISKPLPISLTKLEEIQASGTLSECSNVMTAKCILALYNITHATASTIHKNNKLGIFEDVNEFLDHEDLNLFFNTLQPRIPNGTFPTVRSIDGGTNNKLVSAAGLEATLDFEISYPIIYPQKSVLYIVDDPYYEDNYDFSGFFNTFLDGIDGSYCNYTAYGITGNSDIDPQYPDTHTDGYDGSLQCGAWKPTNVISLSYGLPETGYDIPSNYQQRQCSEYMKLGLQGVSVVFASGDDGVGSAEGCLNGGTVFSPDFPANCPYVTAVGATSLTAVSGTDEDEEVATTAFSSGGGFSNIFSRPSYQNSAVTTYFNSSSAPTYDYYSGSSYGDGLYNRTGRGYPDVAAIGQSVTIFCNGEGYLVEGTSCSAPVFAAVLTRINDARLLAGKSKVGFVNPTLYAYPDMFNDVTSGSNPACSSDGFEAGVGWDPVTGLGTPNFPAMMDVFMSLA